MTTLKLWEGGKFGDEGDDHAHREWSILNSLIDHAHFNVVFTGNGQWQNKLKNFMFERPDAIIIMGCSAYAETDKDGFSKWQENELVRELCGSGNLIISAAGGNIKPKNGELINKSYHCDYDGDEHGVYSLYSNANGKTDPNQIAFLVTVGTNANGDINQTNETVSCSRFPTGFLDEILFAGRTFPTHSINNGRINAEGNTNNGKYATSYTNYVNVAMMSICFQMYAEAKDVFELLDMVRSTCLTDYIRFDLNGDGDTNDIIEGQPESQPLQLINPAGLYKKYLTPQNLPTTISAGETVTLDKGYYKGVLFSIPGAEVKINGEWIAFDNKNKEVIMSQNPMTLEWRLDGDLLKRYGFTSGQTVEGQVITVDDNWNGLRLEVPMSVRIN